MKTLLPERMIKFYTFFLITISFFFNHFGNAQTINLNIKKAAGKTIKIGYYLGDKTYLVSKNDEDVTTVLDENGQGKIDIGEQAPGTYILLIYPEQDNFTFIYEGGNLNLHADYNQIIEHSNNSLSNNIEARLAAFDQKAQKISESKINESEKETKFDNLRKAYQLELENIYKEYPNALKTKMMKAGENIDVPKGMDDDQLLAYYQEHFFDNIDFSQTWLMRTPFMSSKIDTYFEKLVVNEPDSIIKAVDDFAYKVKNNEEMFKYFLIDRLNDYAISLDMGHDKVYHHIVQKYYKTGRADWVSDEKLKEILKGAKDMEGTFLGDTATPFTYKTLSGQTKDFSSFKQNKYTVLFFTDLSGTNAQKYEDKLDKEYASFPEGTKVIRVVLNDNSSIELSSFQKNDSYATTVFHNENIDQIKKAYNFYVMPKIYVLDKDKKIVMKNISFESIGLYLNN